MRCHRPGNAKGDLSLATIQSLRENDFILDGDAANSHLLELITGSDDAPPQMPADGEPLSTGQVSIVRDWINQGSDWPDDFVVQHESKGGSDWWAFQPLRSLPTIDDDSNPTETIDQLIDESLKKQGLQRNPAADRKDLIRRATYDLIGLPPTVQEIQSFVNDPSPDAYAKLIDRLLASNHYGERWGRHWLDVVRFGESVGFERNNIIDNLWPFRDYVIRNINEDRPFDQLIREHLAGDVIDPDQPDTIIGSAFLVAGPYDNVNNQDAVQQAQIRANTLDEMIRATSEAFLGLTVGCARCHDHKFDPIKQQDYYAFFTSFAGMVHGTAPLASDEQQSKRAALIQPLEKQKREIEAKIAAQKQAVLERAEVNRDVYESRWTRPPVDRSGTTESFPAISAKFVRLICEAQDINPKSASGFRIDEFQIWSDEPKPRNVALASAGGKASGRARQIEDFPGAYGPQLTIDGETGARFMAVGSDLTIELGETTAINRVVFSSAMDEPDPGHNKFVFVADYRIETSLDGETWTEVANGDDRQPAQTANSPDGRVHREHRLAQLETTNDERAAIDDLQKQLGLINDSIRQIPTLPSAWVGTRSPELAKGPFHVFLGGSPQKPGDAVVPHSMHVFDHVANTNSHAQDFAYQLPADSAESQRRLELARWITNPANPLTPRVLANRVWQYHFGAGIVRTPSDFGYMGGQPSHPKLLDYLARQLQQHDWRLKPLHRMIMLSKTYQQSADYREAAASVDGQSQLLWRFPPRRLSAEEVRDTMLQVSGSWNRSIEPDIRVPDGGPGFRLYHYMQDNVSTYKPLDEHGRETYRRAVYHQNARASIVDLMTEFDQPDCAFSTPRRARTTTPLQALTMLNHQFTLDMSAALADRLKQESDQLDEQIQFAFQLCFGRSAESDEIQPCRDLILQHGLVAFCRTLFNTSELIYVQ
ncbi:DUF1553 domain-containing protein [Stieleria sp. TO1_6]|nr:DUF1553 domain-containing protein [Stieleria tagensis]